MFKLYFATRHKIAIAVGVLFLFLDFALFVGSVFFVPLIAIAVTIGWLPYWLDLFAENRRQKELESRFPEFVRNFTGAIKSGMPASQAAIHVADSDYGSLTPYARKLANQLEWAIPFHRAFLNFGRETNNAIIQRAIATVIQAEQAGGNIEDVLASITNSLVEIKKIREQRRSTVHGQVIQSYIIFTVFLGVMVLIQNLLIPYMADFGSSDAIGELSDDSVRDFTTKVDIDFSGPVPFITSLGNWFFSLYGIFLLMSQLQGLFAGIVLGKLAEGDATSGLKHSLIMMTFAFIIISFSQSFV